MFLEVSKDLRTSCIKSYQLVSLEDMVNKHPFSCDLRSWGYGGRKGSKFTITNKIGIFSYIKTDETDKDKLSILVTTL
jgi:hypothetical protein